MAKRFNLFSENLAFICPVVCSGSGLAKSSGISISDKQLFRLARHRLSLEAKEPLVALAPGIEEILSGTAILNGSVALIDSPPLPSVIPAEQFAARRSIFEAVAPLPW